MAASEQQKVSHVVFSTAVFMYVAESALIANVLGTLGMGGIINHTCLSLDGR